MMRVVSVIVLSFHAFKNSDASSGAGRNRTATAFRRLVYSQLGAPMPTLLLSPGKTANAIRDLIGGISPITCGHNGRWRTRTPSDVRSTRFQDGGRPTGRLHLPGFASCITRLANTPSGFRSRSSGLKNRRLTIRPTEQKKEGGGHDPQARQACSIRLATGAVADPPFTFRVCFSKHPRPFKARRGNRTRTDRGCSASLLPFGQPGSLEQVKSGSISSAANRLRTRVSAVAGRRSAD